MAAGLRFQEHSGRQDGNHRQTPDERRVTSPGDLVVDPLAGSFTCAEACLSLGRKYVGCDADPACLELAKRRFNDTQARLYDELTEEDD